MYSWAETHDWRRLLELAPWFVNGAPWIFYTLKLPVNESNAQMAEYPCPQLSDCTI